MRLWLARRRRVAARLISAVVLGLLAFGLFSGGGASADPTYNTIFKVFGQPSNLPVPNAHIRIQERGYRVKWEADTGPDGSVMVPIDVVLSNYYFAQIHRDGFEDATVSFYLDQRRLGQPYNQVVNLSVPNILLKRVAGVEVNVHVTAADDHQPVSGAAVVFMPRDNRGSAWGKQATNDQGDAVMFLEEGGAFEVTVTHSNFDTANDTQTINRYGEGLALSYALVRKPRPAGAGDYYIDVTVLGLNEAGEAAPLAGAAVSTAGGSSAPTDGAGFAQLFLKEAYGAEVTVTAAATGFKSQSQQLTLDTQASNGVLRLRGTPRQGGLTFRLQPGEGETTHLVVVVLDHDTDQPVKNATVSLGLVAGSGALGSASVNGSGEASFDVNFRRLQAIAKDGLRASVRSPNYEEKWSDISMELLQPTDQKHLFTVYLTPKNLDLTGFWRWRCCSSNRHDGDFTLTMSPDGHFTGSYGAGGGGTIINGVVSGDQVHWTRIVNACGSATSRQEWNATLVVQGDHMRMENGVWSGACGQYGDGFDFSAEK